MKPGDTFDRYSILRRVGQGGMGDVYRAHDTRLHRSVALKILRLDSLVAEGEPLRAETVDRMFREARAAAALEHPNVVVIHDVGEVRLEGAGEPSYFIAMEYVHGVSLRAMVGATGVSLEDRVRWLFDIARALEFAHERGIIHRDVKPENIMIRSDGVVKVLDFGIARRARGEHTATTSDPLSTLTGRGVALGTPRYMAPEQMLGEDLDGRADQYAWGLTAYELLCGSAPWSGAPDSLQLVAQALTRNPEPLRARAPEVPEALAAIVDRALSRERSARFPSMTAVLEALEESGVLGPANKPRPTPRPPPPDAPDPPLPDVSTLRGHHSTRRAHVGKPARAARPAAVAALGAVCLGGAVYGVARSRLRAPAPSSVAAPSSSACSSHAACARALGAPAVCGRAGACVALASEDCRVQSDPNDVTHDATVWVGALFPLTGPDAAAYGTRELQAVELARRDFSQMLAGSTARPNGSHPIALVACDDAVDPSRALRHLVDEVGVPAVIGFRTSNEAIDDATSTLIPKGILGIAALNTSPMISSLPQLPGQPRMIWRTTYSAAEMALPVARLVPDVLEPELKPALGGQPLRVALVRQDDATGLGFADTLFRSLRFNDRSALENESSYREFVSTLVAGRDPAEYESLVGKLVAFAPHVIVYYGSDEALVRIAGPLERAWRGAVRPRYVKTSPLGPPVYALIAGSADRRRRFLSITTVSTTAANARFVARYNEAYADSVTRTFSPNSSYDAFYVIAYATFALGDAPVTGAGLAGAIARLTPPGLRIDVGPSGIFDAINRLASGGRVDLNGATGPLDFDPLTGDAPVDLAVLCVAADARGMAVDNRESGLVYDATAGVLRGTMRCP